MRSHLSGTTAPTISKNIPDTVRKYCKRPKEKLANDAIICKRVLTCVQINQMYTVCPSTIRTMQKRFILLWNACTKYKDLQTLQPTQKNALELWGHIRYCRDEDCKRKYCSSSCCIVGHFNQCRESNRRSTCKFCAPLVKYIAKESSGNKKLMNRQHDKIQMEMKKQSDQILDGNKLSIKYNSKRIPEEVRHLKTTVTRVKRNVISHKQRCTVIRWDQSVKSGQGEDSVAQVIQRNDMKKRPLLLHGVQRYTNKQTYKKGKTRNIRNPNRIISSGMKSANTSLSDIGNTFVASCIMEEEKKEIVDASMILLELKKRTWGEMFTEDNTTSTSMMVVDSLSTSNYKKTLS